MSMGDVDSLAKIENPAVVDDEITLSPRGKSVRETSTKGEGARQDLTLESLVTFSLGRKVCLLDKITIE